MTHDEWPSFFDEVEQNLERGWSWSGFERSVFFPNKGKGNFEVNVAPMLGLDQVGDGRGVAAGDIDNDGDLDLVCSNRNKPAITILRNEMTTGGHFLFVDLVPKQNRSPAGSKIVVTAGNLVLRRDVVLGSGFMSQHDTCQHFGLNSEERADSVEVTWPDGETEVFNELKANRKFRIRQGEGLEDLP